MSAMEQAGKVPINSLHADYLLAFNHTLGSILSSALAGRTFAQIFDGLPTRDDVGYFPTYSKEIAGNTSSSAEAMKAASELLQDFSTYFTLVDAKVSSKILCIRKDANSLRSWLKLTRTLIPVLTSFICGCWRC